ncbi:MAG: gamma-glutamyltransferase family protein [Alphaproteobacteria bacterium]|nr:MAG: gamma-glutamyltransferase family protein [Alphaproteobacteria bacterium]
MRDFHLPGRSPVISVNGMCATSHPLAAKCAVSMLEEGGNAVDAAVAAALLLGICEPQMTGLGGDMFALVQPGPGRKVIGLNASGRAPAALDAVRLRADGLTRMPEKGAIPVTIPGAVDGFCRLLEDHGRLGREAVLAPAIRYAEEGVPVAPRVAHDWALAAPDLLAEAREFYLVDDAAPQAGDLFRAPGQAEVLRRIAAEGRAGFYEGEVAADMLAGLRAHGGIHTEADFAATACDYVEPIRGPYRGYDLVEIPPNGQGATALLMAAILERFDLSSHDPLGAQRIHLEAEAAKLAYDARNRLIGDPATAPDAAARMRDPALAEALAGLIDPDRAMADPAPLTEAVHRDTIYLTVVDRDRMAVSLIYSIFHSFGSGLASPRFGINFHNRGAGFNLIPGHPNEAAGGKRPMHTIIPAMLMQGDTLCMPFGVMGAEYQPAGHFRVMSNIRDFGMHPQQAIDAPRSFPQVGRLDLERGYAADVRAALSAKGHQVTTPANPLGGAQAIWLDATRGVLIGASDPRKDGCALGY